MTDKWLEEIEGRLNRRAIGGVHIVGGIVRPWDDDAAWLQAKEYTRSDMTRLIAFVRELQAQAALDAAVREAAGGVCRVASPDHDNKGYYQVSHVQIRRLDAALAKREKGAE